MTYQILPVPVCRKCGRPMELEARLVRPSVGHLGVKQWWRCALCGAKKPT